MACHIVSLEKSPGVSPVDIGNIIRCLLVKCALLVIGTTEKEAFGNLNLCVVLRAGIEGSVHDTQVNYRKTQCIPVADQALLAGGAAKEKYMIGAVKF